MSTVASTRKVNHLKRTAESVVDAPALQPGFSLSLVVVGLVALTMLLGVLPGLLSDTTSTVTFAAVR